MSTPLKGLVIGRTTGRCAATDRELVAGEPCFTALVRPLPDPEAPASDRSDEPASSMAPAPSEERVVHTDRRNARGASLVGRD